MKKDGWYDRYTYRRHHDDMPDGEWNERLYVSFCPEGEVSVGDILRSGPWTQEVLYVESHYKYIEWEKNTQ